MASASTIPRRLRHVLRGGAEVPARLRRRGVDLALWAALTAVVAAEVSGRQGAWPAVELPVVAVVFAIAVAVHRTRPVTALALALAATVVQGIAHVLGLFASFGIVYALPVAVFAWLAGRRTERTRPVVVLCAAACAAVLGAYIAVWVEQVELRAVLTGLTDWSGAVLMVLGVVLAPWLGGRYWSRRTELSAAGWAIADRMERERQADADRARLRERARIATRMHDSLGHDLTMIGVRAAAMEMAAGDDADQHAAASALRQAAHEATLHLREIIGVLRTDDPPPHDASPTEDVSSLVSRANGAGLQVKLIREGPDTDPDSPAGRAIGRVVQEALTNAARHAPEAAVTVHVSREDGTTAVCVSDDGAAAVPATPGSGTGLAGLDAEVTRLGGDFQAGPRGDAPGFAVTARISDTPADGPAAEAPSQTARVRSELTVRARQRLVTAIAVPLVLTLTIAGLGFGALAYVGVNSVLPPERYAELRVGADYGEVAEVLPRFEKPHDTWDSEPPVPDGAHCAYYLQYWENGLPPVYRLCFADGRLVAKDAFAQR